MAAKDFISFSIPALKITKMRPKFLSHGLNLLSRIYEKLPVRPQQQKETYMCKIWA